MEGRKQTGSSSSLTNELFGSKESSSSSGIFGSIFSPPSKVLGRESLRSESMEKKHDYSKEAWNTKPGAPDDASRSYETESQGTANKDMSSMYQDQRVQQPCHLSSSIYYGGQDVYSQPPNSQGSGINSVFKKDGGEDDTGSASRGNWWQGSLYY
ncbi:Plant/T7H20-70 protein [Melia azedarach]|uniref:Plant/T7H20-70 protein n=1 Tax=Melia azedarach TaxID=155640 RepID=A0ACC1X0Z1_MELAZ|nr:Plant/T7H20-70 protein [Melia azedarach]